MKIFILFWSLVNAFTAFGDEAFVNNREDLHAETKARYFFDPHNHTGGILPEAGIISPEKFIGGIELTDSELKDFWFKFAQFYPTSTLPRSIDKGTKLVINCNEPSQYCGDSSSDPAKCTSSLRDAIANILTATPLTAFQTAYGIRAILLKVPDLPKSTGLTHTQAQIFEMAKTLAQFVELSKAFIGGPKDVGTDDFSKYKEILDDLRAPETSEPNQLLKQRITELGLPIPNIKWLLLTHTLELGKTSETMTLTYELGQCIGKDMPENLNTDPASHLYQTLVTEEDVVGVDVAGPEYTCFSNHGMNDFKELATTTYKAAQARRQNQKTPTKMVVRVHVGEGAPLKNIPDIIDQQQACEEAKKFPEITKDNETNLYVHQAEARKNISVLLSAIDQLKKEFTDIDDYIVFRLGHLTHITKEQASLAKDLGITADVNLSSNISTQALPVDKTLIDEYLVKNGVYANNVRDLYAALEQHGAPVGKIFEGHGLKWLLYYDIPTMLGTDGSGVEHSSSLAREYKIAEKLIDDWNTNDQEFNERGSSIDKLLQNQQRHFDNMGYGNSQAR